MNTYAVNQPFTRKHASSDKLLKRKLIETKRVYRFTALLLCVCVCALLFKDGEALFLELVEKCSHKEGNLLNKAEILLLW